ncbi:MAG: MipA/OmpV family protein [Alphaproteobacteria bacterium]|nr:MipA/OmpV family protein [Alphaproteobacteria bacterium]
MIRRIVAMIGLAVLASASAQGQTLEPKGEWTVAIGAVGQYQPDYLGGDDYVVRPWPRLFIDWKDTITLDVGGSLMENDSLKITGWRGRNWRLGFIATFDQGRDHGVDSRLLYFSDVDPTVEAGMFYSFFFDHWKFDFDARQDAMDGHGGLVSDFRLAWGAKLTNGARMEFGPSLTVATAPYQKSYFGMSQREAWLSNLNSQRVYQPGSGLRDVSLGGRFFYPITDKWFAELTGRYMQLMGDAADSPVIRSESQIRVGLGIGYRF